MKSIAGAVVILLLAGCLCAQEYTAPDYESLNNSGVALTIQTVANASPTYGAVKQVRLVGADVCPSVATTLTLEHTGTAATTTAAVPHPTAKNMAASTATVYVQSNAGVGTVINTVLAPAGVCTSFKFVKPDGTTSIQLARGEDDNFTLRVGTMTGTVYLLIHWQEVN